MIRAAGFFTIAATLVVLAAGCESDSGQADGGSTVDVSLKDFDLTLSPDSASAGDVTFSTSNDGPSTHEFEIMSGAENVELDSLPIENDVADTTGLTLVDEVEDVTPGSTTELTVGLEPGTYAIICNLPAHFAQGMHATLTVT